MKITYSLTPQGKPSLTRGQKPAGFTHNRTEIDSIRDEVLDIAKTLARLDEKKADLAQGDPGYVVVEAHRKGPKEISGQAILDSDGSVQQLKGNVRYEVYEYPTGSHLGEDHRVAYTKQGQVETFTFIEPSGRKQQVIQDNGRGTITLLET